MGVAPRRAGSPEIGDLLPGVCPRRPCEDPRLGDLRTARRLVLCREWYCGINSSEMAALHRSAGPGKQVFQEHGKEQQDQDCQADRLRLHQDARELSPIRIPSASRERSGRTRPIAGATSLEADVQAGWGNLHPIRGCND
eukprot:383004-Hanusia_phi.AAC.3